MRAEPPDTNGGAPADAITSLLECMSTLRAECPWDRAQTHATLRRHLLEEAHEALEALDRMAGTDRTGGDAGLAYDDLCEELGDVLLQVVFHAAIAQEAGRFDFADVVARVTRKLIDRHGAIFSGQLAGDADDPSERGAAWEKAKVAEKGRGSVMDGMPRTLPALLYSSKVLAKARVTAPDLAVTETLAEPLTDEGDLGRRLFGLVDAARQVGLDPEAELRRAAAELERAVRHRETIGSNGISGGADDPVAGSGAQSDHVG